MSAERVTVAGDVGARVLLSHLTDGPDPDLLAHLTQAGAPAVVAALRSGASPLRRAAAYGARLGALGDSDLVVGHAMERIERLGGRVLVPGGDGWPQGLDHLGSRAPLLLWVRGPLDLAALDLPRSVAVVGARAATAYGAQVAASLAADLAERGCCVVSGGAYGIDAAAHRGALAVGGPTIAVLAGGVDDVYPRGNAALLDRIATEHLLISEAPPGRRPTRTGFLHRNRLIAALAGGTVVVEAAVRSGSLSTVLRAGELGREVMAVPGPVTSATSVGTNQLLRDGATPVTCADDVLDALGPLDAAAATQLPLPQPTDRDRLDTDARIVLDALPARGVIDPAPLAVAAGLPLSRTLTVLGRLVVDGWVDTVDGAWRLTDHARRAR